MDAEAQTHDDRAEPSPGTIVSNRAADYASLLSSAEHVLDEVDRVLAALDAGTYGRCSTCGQRIGETLLAAEPLATSCEVHRRAPEAASFAGHVEVPAPGPR